jgi:hypothetical protein
MTERRPSSSLPHRARPAEEPGAAERMRPSLGWLCASLFGVGGCTGTGTDLDQLVNVDPFIDGSAGDAGADADSSFQDPFGGAPAYSAQTGTDSHNAGMSCIHSGCHGSASGAAVGAQSFLVGGTVYADYKGTRAAPGVEVRIVDSAGHSASAYSGPEGNFYIMSTSANGVTFPAVVGARDGTTMRPMITTLTTSMGSCGQTTCHVSGGGPMSNTGNYYPIHLP